ncbi:hypothetical protein VMCG_07378 [Cytospora schulzeri]|uniref:Early meiotic induction protein 1 n=1 Tax=Cytospora schulzeri TaxID=448051 RepID=A0A423W378_9PEZI|nr:hypothetical protein VMCG_07378 [Valsa malicola]
MGWFWQDSASAKPAPSQSTAQAPSQQAQDPADSKSSPDVDPEVRRFLEDLMGATGSSGNERPPPPPPKQTPSGSSTSPAPPQSSLPWSSWFSRSSTPADPSSAPAAPTQRAEQQQHRVEEDHTSTSTPTEEEPRLSPLAESLLPTTMDCEQAFNQAFYCQSLGGQWNNIYRYGAVRPCSENWDDFWFCMRVKGYSEGKVKDDMIREHYRKKHLSKYGSGKPNSEDVWRERRERLPPGTAFAEAAEAPTVSDAEYQRWEMERAERIRNGGSS